MKFLAAALGFNSKEEMNNSISVLSENHCEQIHYIDENGYLKEDILEPIGLYDYYTTVGSFNLREVLHCSDNWFKEDIFNAKFSLKDYIYEDISSEDDEYSLSIIGYTIINTCSWLPYREVGIPGAVKKHYYHCPVIYIYSPVTLIEIKNDSTLWEKLISFYRVLNDPQYKDKTAYMLQMHS